MISRGCPHASLSWAESGRILPSCKAGKILSKLLHVEPLTAFAGDEITEADWSVIVECLADKPNLPGLRAARAVDRSSAHIGSARFASRPSSST